MSRFIKYIDCDGVILDTETGLFDEYEKLKQSDKTLKRSTYLAQLNWYEWIRQAHIIANAIEIIKEQNPEDVVILTKVHSLEEGKVKIEYFREFKIKNNIILVPNALQKGDLVMPSGSLLVDDSTKNLDDWSLHDGISILFRGMEEEKLRDVKYPMVSSLEEVFSKETDDYCRRMRLKSR